MLKRYIFAIVINLLIIILIFGVFFFLDANLMKAERSTDTNNILSENITILSNTDASKISIFNWDNTRYNDLNQYVEEAYYQNLEESSNVIFYSEKSSYYRFEIVRFYLKGVKSVGDFYINVMKDENILPCFLGPTNIHFNKTEKGYQASWFYGWKVATGDYKAVLYYKGNIVSKISFNIISRQPIEFNKTFSSINLEYNQPLKRLINNPDGKKVPFEQALVEWMDYGHLDAFLTLAGETTGWGNITPEKPWEYYPVRNLQILGPELNRKDKLVGAYIMCFYTPNNGWIKGGYKPAKGINADGTIRYGSFISFKDKKRFYDIVNMARYLNSLEYVHFIGFDFIRFGELVGYENADEFVKDMNIVVPGDWKRLGEDEKAIWLGQRLQGGKANSSIKEKWNLWIAHKTANFIFEVRREAGITKPIWVFTLGWNHGMGHGQEPYFFQDAGVFADFVMLYEATPEMFLQMKKSWMEYLKDETLNYVAGNQIDAFLNQSIYGYNPVEEYNYRLKTAFNYAPYYARGMFIHDISRAFWGRKGNFSFYEWFVSGFSALSYLRWLKNEIPFYVSIVGEEAQLGENGKIKIPVEINIREDQLELIKDRVITIEEVGNNTFKKIDISGKTNIIFSIELSSKLENMKWVGLRAVIEGYPPFFTFSYIKHFNTKKLAKNKVINILQ